MSFIQRTLKKILDDVKIQCPHKNVICSHDLCADIVWWTERPKVQWLSPNG